MSDDDRRCGNCCNWKPFDHTVVFGTCVIVGANTMHDAGSHCPSHNIDVAGLREEVERLRAAVRGLVSHAAEGDDLHEPYCSQDDSCTCAWAKFVNEAAAMVFSPSSDDAKEQS